MHYSDIRTFHVGIIMDGNGRWAKARGLNRIAGHIEGANRVSELVKSCPELGITHLTLFAFSTENWQRPLSEVDGLMRIFGVYIRRKMNGLRANDVRVRFIGMRDRVSDELRNLMEQLEECTKDCGGLSLTIALDYGARNEISRAVRSILGRVADGRLLPDQISESTLDTSLDTVEIPDPDFIIRTSGELRVSNFLLWQSAYSEYAFPKTAWPDFTVAHLREEVEGFNGRQRRYGKISQQMEQARATVPVGTR